MVIFITWVLVFPSVIMVQTGGAIQDFSVEVRPPRVGARATYVLNFRLEKALEVRDWIKVQFPKETQLPELSDHPEERRQQLTRIIESIYIGSSPCSSCQGLPEINYQDNSITFNVHLGLDPEIKGYETIRITMTDRIGIVNPENPGWHQLRISTARESVPTVSEKYEILTSRIGDPKGVPIVQTYPSSSGINAGYLITFNLGRGGALRLNQSRVRIEFPPETKFMRSANDIPPQWIQINDRPVSVRLMIHENILTFVTPINIDNASEVRVAIDQEVGIVNPDQPGIYTLKVATSEDTDWVPSKPYTIEKSEPLLTVDPDIVLRNASYELRFLLESFEKLTPEHPMQVSFPESVGLPDHFEESFISINEQVVAKVESKDQHLAIYPSQSVAPGDIVVLRFEKELGIINPGEPYLVRLNFLCEGSKAIRYSSPVQIKTIQLQWNNVTINPPNASSSAEYHFSFQLGSRGRLSEDDYIQIFYPSTSSYNPFSTEILAKIFLNGESLDTYQWLEEDGAKYLRINPQFTIPEETMVEVIIPREVGLHNPTKENEWVHFYLSTSVEKDPVASTSIFIPPTLPQTQWKIIEGKEGNKEWFVDPPTIELISDQDQVNIYYWWDNNKENTLLYTNPIRLDPGFYTTTLNFYAESAYGKENTQEVVLKVDTQPPYFIVEHPPSARFITNQPTITISGKVAPVFLQQNGGQITVIDQPLWIQEKEVKVNEDGSFETRQQLNEGENSILIRCYDEAGNYTDRTLNIILDTVPPELTIFSPSHESTILSSSVTIKGKTSPDAQLTLQGTLVPLDEEGNFEHSYNFPRQGLNTIIIEATDSAGNISQKEWKLWAGVTLLLTIGSEVVVVNDQNKFIDVAPLIINGRTLVPLRILAEEFGAELGIEFDAKSGKVTMVTYELNQIKIELFINKYEALVNGEQVLMEVPAMIINGRTLVPLRFVAESLQAEVKWDAVSESITIVYWENT